MLRAHRDERDPGLASPKPLKARVAGPCGSRPAARLSALRARLERTAAQIALHQAGLPRAEAIREMCEQFVEQAQGATRQTKRALLEALEAVVLVQGNHFRFEGVLGDLGVWGELPVHASPSAS